MRIFLLPLAAAVFASLSGCGGGGGAGGDAPPGDRGRVLGTRSVPGGSVSVSADTAVQPGAAAVFRLALSPGMPPPTAVSAWIGTAYDPAAAGIAAMPVLTAPGSYAVTATVPAPLPPGSHLWVRLGFADGSVIETGSGDFPLAGP